MYGGRRTGKWHEEIITWDDLSCHNPQPMVPTWPHARLQLKKWLTWSTPRRVAEECGWFARLLWLKIKNLKIKKKFIKFLSTSIHSIGGIYLEIMINDSIQFSTMKHSYFRLFSPFNTYALMKI